MTDMINLMASGKVVTNEEFEVSFNNLWQDIEDTQHGLYFDNRVMPTSIDITSKCKQWLKRNLTEIHETLIELNSPRKRMNFFVRCNTEESTILTDIAISKDGILLTRNIVTPTVRTAYE